MQQTDDMEGSMESPNLEFEYGDTDGLTAELSELYSYTEEPEFSLNRDYFEEDFRNHAKGRRWVELSTEEQRAYIMRLLDALEVTDRDKRLKVARAILYLAQGVFDECDTETDVLHWSRHNVFLLYDMGIFTALLELLSMEIDGPSTPSELSPRFRSLCFLDAAAQQTTSPHSRGMDGFRRESVPLNFISQSSVQSLLGNNQACSSAVRKPAISLADSTELRVLLSIMYLIVETIRVEMEDDRPEWRTAREAFKTELGSPLYNSEPFALLLFTMVTKFCSMSAPHFPMKKVLLLLWKTLLFTLGGFEDVQEMKVGVRARLSLPPLPEDSIKVVRSMRAASPPASAMELIEQQQQQKRGRRSRRSAFVDSLEGDSPFARKQPLVKQDSLDTYNERDPFKNDDARDEEDDGDDVDSGIEGEVDPLDRDVIIQPTPLPLLPRPPSERVSFPKGLPWAPKVREKDIEHFLEASRNKFIGFTLGNDTETLVGLPRPIHESVKTLKQDPDQSRTKISKHKYISIAEVQIKREEELQQCPMTMGEEHVQETPAEALYVGMLPSLSQYVIALLKLLLAAAPTSKAKTDSINILADVLPEEMPITVLQSMKLGIDVNRHKEIIVKAISALLLLLLKHFKLNHIYQFEYVSQHLVFANCIPLILKFFNQNIMSYISAKNSICVLDFPHCAVHEMPELTAESLEAGDSNQFCWRNLFSCINLLRILNKLTKWKHSRTMMLVVFKSAPILKRALKVKQAMMQLYVLKLLKIQTKYLGRQWRKSNMKTMSAIYQKVRHRLNDDWAYGNDIDARPWDFQAEECALRESIEKFNTRRYDRNQNSEFAPVDNCLQSVLGQRVELPEDFHYSYEMWLEREVFSQPVQWEGLLQPSDPVAGHGGQGAHGCGGKMVHLD
ncbi:striatin-interacting protein 2 isoform X1 [Electrophorus electricus]|uniref:striatin-interacting protein 2 isoform X1 n=1 Tax=Electrophorus electricus TaxID=8005 RepID=UPI0015CFCEF5|nr:striatin-interacting protein 2 isoform X1 [Electrophorus electricus]